MSGSIIQFPLRLGLAEDANPKSPPMSSLKSGINVRWVKDGVLGKRFGYGSLGALPGGSVAPRRFLTRGDELSYTDGAKLFTYSPNLGTWSESDRVSEVGLEWSTILDDENGVSQSAVVVLGDMLLEAHIGGDPARQDGSAPVATGSQNLFVQVVNWRTGQVIVKPTRIATCAFFLRVLLDGDYAVVLYSTPSAIHAQRVCVNESLGVALDVAGDASVITHVRFDLDPHGIDSRLDAILLSTGKIAVVYERDAAHTAALVVQLFTVASGVLTASGSPAAYTGEIDVKAVALAEDVTAGLVYALVSRINGDPTHAIRLLSFDSTTLAASLAAFTVLNNFRGHHVTLAVPTTGNVLVMYSGINQTSPQWPETQSQLIAADGSLVAQTLRVSPGVMLLTSLFTLGTRRYAFMRDAHYGENQYYDPTANGGLGGEITKGSLAALPSLSSYLVEVEYDVYSATYAHVPHRLVGKVDHDIAAVVQQGSLPNVATVDASTVLAATPFQATASPLSFNFRVGLRLVTASVDATRLPDAWRCVSIGQESYLNGGVFSAWDGRTVFDYGMREPYVYRAGQQDNTGSMANGSYLYQFVAMYRSHAGILHRGPMSIPANVPLSDISGGGSEDGFSSVRIGVLPNAIDGKETAATAFGFNAALKSFFTVYRSEVDQAVLYERTFGPRLRMYVNRPAEAPTDFIDALNDDNIATDSPVPDLSLPAVALSSRPQPYVATGELEDVQPPAQYTCCYHLGRIFLVLGDRRTLWFSKPFEENPGIAPGFNQDFVRIFDKPITAIASYVDRLIVFFERGAKFIVGDGPTVANTDDRFSTPQALQGEIGTTNPRSLVVTPVGLFFQTTGGELYVLDGGLAMTWIGKDVRDTLAAYPVITSAVHVAEQREVRFTCNTSDGSAGIILVFDYQRGTWMTRTTPGSAAIVDAILWSGVYVFATASALYKERSDRHYDVVTGYAPSSVVLNPISPSGPMAWHRVKRVQLIGRSRAPHTLTIAVARDFAEATEQTKTWDASSDVTQVGPLERAQLALAHQKAQAIEVHISDADPDLGGEEDNGGLVGFELEGVALLVQTKQGLARITKSRRG